MPKMIDGWKSLIVVLGVIITNAIALFSGYDMTDLMAKSFEEAGWADQDLLAWAQKISLIVAPLIVAIIAAWSRVRKAIEQRKAGATASELLGPIGYVKAAAKDGTLTSQTRNPVVLHMTDAPPTEAKPAPVVASMVAEPTPTAR